MLVGSSQHVMMICPSASLVHVMYSRLDNP